MKKICNFRPILFFTMSLIVGGYIFVAIKKYDFVSLIFLGLILLLSGIGVYLLLKQKNVKSLVVILACFIIPSVLGGSITLGLVDKKIDDYGKDGSYIITGTVVSGISHDGEYKISLKDVYLVSKTDLNTYQKVDGEVNVKFFVDESAPDVYIGDTVCFYGRYNYCFEKYFNQSSLNAESYVAEVQYGGDLCVLTEGSGLKYNILKWTKNQLYNNMDKNSADIAFGMIFGEKALLDKGLKKQYSVVGLSHILAVSGLHVGFIILFIGFLLKKIIKNKWVYSGVLLIFLIFYAYICGWSPSVLRAVSMCVLTLLAGNIFYQYDALNALSIAGIINFIISPLNIFNIGFILSFFVSFSLISISPKLTYALAKVVPQKLASALSVTTSAYIGSVPVILFYFQSISIYSVIANFIVVPTISVLFITIVATLLLSGMFGSAQVFLSIPNVFIKCLNFVVEGFSKLKFSFINLTSSYMLLLLGVLTSVLLGDYVFIKKKNLYAGTLAFGFLCCCVVYTLS